MKKNEIISFSDENYTVESFLELNLERYENRIEKIHDLKIDKARHLFGIDLHWMHSRFTVCKSLPIIMSGALFSHRAGQAFILVSFPNH